MPECSENKHVKTEEDGDRWCLCSGDNMIYTNPRSTKLIWIISQEGRIEGRGGGWILGLKACWLMD